MKPLTREHAALYLKVLVREFTPIGPEFARTLLRALQAPTPKDNESLLFSDEERCVYLRKDTLYGWNLRLKKGQK